MSHPLTFYWPNLAPPNFNEVGKMLYSCALEGERAELFIDSSMMPVVYSFDIIDVCSVALRPYGL